MTYDSSLSANSYLGGKTYTLAGGGTLAPAGGSSTGSSAPTIASGGVTNAASGASGVVPGGWVSIYGTNLASAAVTAGASDMASGYLPTALGGTNVYIDGKPAYVYYVSPTQINVVAPADSLTGDATVTVTNSGGSASATATMRSVQPGLFVASNHVLAVRVSDSKVIDASGTVKPGRRARNLRHRAWRHHHHGGPGQSDERGQLSHQRHTDRDRRRRVGGGQLQRPGGHGLIPDQPDCTVESRRRNLSGGGDSRRQHFSHNSRHSGCGQLTVPSKGLA